MFAGFLEIFKAFFLWLKIPILAILTLLFIFIFLICLNIIIRFLKGDRPLKAESHVVLQKRGFFKKIFYDLPKQISNDFFTNDPDEFKPHGLIIFEGRQGRGKTISMIEYATRLIGEYPLAKCLSNLNFTKQDEELDHWKKLIDFKNGKYGVVALIDETQNWFSSKQSKDFPPEMLQVITQNRKNRRVILRYCPKFLFIK